MIIIGIDPGASGAISEIRQLNNEKVIGYGVHDVPWVKVKINKRVHKDYDLTKCRKLLKDLTRRYSKKEIHICIEGVQAFYFSSKVSNFAMGRGRGFWEGLATGLGLKYTTVSPHVWKKHFGLKKKGGDDSKKDADVRKARKLFPLAKEILTDKRHDRSDALLIAEYRRRELNGKI